MIRRALSIFALCGLFAFAVHGAPPAELMTPGPRPSLPVFDPAGTLPPDLAQKLGETLQDLRTRELIDIVVVVAPDIGEAPVEHVARQFADAWCFSDANCVVFHQPDGETGPRIFPGGRVVREVKPEVFKRAVAAAERRAGLEPSEPAKVSAAANEAIDLLRYWVGSAMQVSEEVITRRTRMRLEHEQALQRRKIMMLGAAASFIPLLLGAITLFFAIRKRRSCRFPPLRWQSRLGAPHAGGNHAVIDLGPSPKMP